MAGTLQNIRYFVAAYEEGSFTKAALRENATQPGVSHHIRKLENTLGTALFVRRNSTVEATAAGHVFYEHCLKVMEAHDRAMSSVSHLVDERSEQITVGLVPTLTRRAITPAIQAFMVQNPSVKINIIEGPCNEVVAMAARKELDFAIGQRVSTDATLVAAPLFDSPSFLVSRRTPGVPNLLPFGPSAGRPLKLLWPNTLNPHRQMIESFVDAAQISVSRSLEVVSVQLMLDLVTTSDWQTILPYLMFDQNDLARFDLAPITLDCSLPLFLYHPAKKDLSTASRDLIEQITGSVRHILQRWDLLIRDSEQVSSPSHPSDTSISPA